MCTSTTTASEKNRDREDGEYRELVQRLRNVNAWPLFTTNADDADEGGGNRSLYDDFLDALPASRRQHYKCRACRKFVSRFGGLVTIDERGHSKSLLWSFEPESESFFRDAILSLNARVANASVTGVFLNNEGTWGLVENKSPKNPEGVWRHMHVMVDLSRGDMHKNRNRNSLLTAEQAMAEKLQDYDTLGRALDDFSVDLVRKAHTLLTTGALARSEKCIGVAKWLLDLHESLGKTKHHVRQANLIWRAIALAPPGFAHIRSTMIGALLSDLAEDKPFPEIKAAFDAKMSPILYQRPQAAPTDGQLAAAEAVIAKLASSGSLARRFARLDEIIPHAIWVPKANGDSSDGSVFGHLKASKKSEIMDLPKQTITWDKFSWTVLPKVEKLELLVPHGAANFFAFVTAVDPDAPPILQWDREDRRNTVSWYLYHNGSRAEWWGLREASFCDVTAVAPQPSGWNESDLKHQGDGAYLILKGARDLHYRHAGLGLFPEVLRAEYRGIRAAMEAYSRSKELEGSEEASACGLALQNSSSWNYTVRATSEGTRILYRLDRFD